MSAAVGVPRWRMAITAAGAMIAVAVGSPAFAAATEIASADDIRQAITTMERAMIPGQGFAWHPIVRADGAVAAIEIWKAPAPPALHPDEAEYATVIEGTGTLVYGGTMGDPKTVRPGLVEGSRIEGGTTRPLKPGDVFLIPAGTPHWFGITGRRLVLLGTKIPQSAH